MMHQDWILDTFHLVETRYIKVHKEVKAFLIVIIFNFILDDGVKRLYQLVNNMNQEKCFIII